MRQAIPGLDVYELSNSRELSLRPDSPQAQRVPYSTAMSAPPGSTSQRTSPNWTFGGRSAPRTPQAPVPSSAVSLRAPMDVAAPQPGRGPNPPPRFDYDMKPPGMAEKAWRSLRAGAGSTARAALPGMAGAQTAALLNVGRQAALDAEPAFEAPEAKPGDIPTDTRFAAPRALAGSTLAQTELGRNVGNAVMAIPAGSGVLRAATAAPRALQAGVMALPAAVGKAAGQGFVAGDAATRNLAPTLLDSPTPPVTGDPNFDSRRFSGPSGPTGPVEGQIVRDGNSYSGTNVKFGADIVNPDGSLRPQGFGVTSLDTSEGARQDILELQRNAAARAAGPQGPTLIGIGGDSGELRGRKADRALRLRETQIGAETQRLNAELNNETLRRGQDITNTGNILDYDAKSRRLRQEGARAERDFQTARGDKAFEQRGARETQLQKKIEDLTMTVDDDGKPMVDARAAREYRSGLERSVARLGGKSLADLDQDDEQKLFAASDLLKTMRANAGVMPWNPDKLKTIDPVDLVNLRVLENGDRQITNPDSAAKGQTIPRRFFETEQGTRFFSDIRGTPTNKYDMLSEGR